MAKFIIKSNESIRKSNYILHSNSQEEEEFQHGAFTGMLSSWTTMSKTLYLPLGRNSLFFTTKKVKVPLPSQQGLPEDVARLVSAFFTRKEANAAIQTCRIAQQTARESKEICVVNYGRSYIETPYEPNPYLII